MDKQNYEPISMACHEINRQVKLAEQRQQMYYRNEPIRPVKQGVSLFSRVWKAVGGMATVIKTDLAPRASAYAGRPSQHTR